MIQRRSFLSALSGAFAARPVSPVTEQSTIVAATWQPARHAEDDWMDQPPAKHRMVFDTITPDGFGRALLFGSNFLDTNKNAYGLEYADVGLMIIVRYNSTPFAYNDAMWSKYGSVFAQKTGFTDPKTKESPKSNLFNASTYGSALTSNGITLDSMIKRGLRIPVCRLATR